MAKIMKILFVAVLVIFVALQSEATMNLEDVENLAKNETLVVGKLREIIIGLKRIMKEGNESLQLPVTDPLEIDSKDLNIDTIQFRGHLSFGNVNITGLSEYVINNIAFRYDNLLLQISLEWPKISVLVINYTISDGKIMNLFKARGSGTVSLAAKNVKYSINTTIGINKDNSTLYMKDFENNISIGENGDKKPIELQRVGSVKQSFVSKMLVKLMNKNAVKMFNKNNKIIESRLQVLIKLAVNDFLKNKTVTQLAELV